MDLRGHCCSNAVSVRQFILCDSGCDRRRLDGSRHASPHRLDRILADKSLCRQRTAFGSKIYLPCKRLVLQTRTSASKVIRHTLDDALFLRTKHDLGNWSGRRMVRWSSATLRLRNVSPRSCRLIKLKFDPGSIDGILARDLQSRFRMPRNHPSY
jgi:hypothetical protein